MTSAALASGLTGCDGGVADSPAAIETAVDALTPVLFAQQQLLVAYDRTLAAFPELDPTLSPLQAQSESHTRALLEAAPAAAAQIAAAGDRDASSSSTPSSARSDPPAADAPTAVAELARTVHAAALGLNGAALRAYGDLAALLGSCAASTTCHARLLGL